jgi:hypothetical protein
LPVRRSANARSSSAAIAIYARWRLTEALVLDRRCPVRSLARSRLWPDAHPIAATSSTKPASTSPVNGPAAGAGARSVESSQIPIDPRGPPSHTNDIPSA